MADTNNKLSEYYRPKARQPDPVELVLLTLWEMTSLGEFVQYFRVCKKWDHWGQIILHRLVVLDSSSLASFVDCARLRPERFLSIKSLTVRLKIGLPGFDGQIYARAGWRTKEGLLRKLADIMNHHMHGLQAFSFQIEDEPIGYISIDGISAEPRIAADAVICLLLGVPLACKSLEIDTGGFEFYIEDDHLCPYIQRLMTTLCHLRLRVGRICPDFISAPAHESCEQCPDDRRKPVAPNLKSLTVSMELSDAVVGGSTRCSLAQPMNPSYRIFDDDPTDRLQSEITKTLRIGHYNKNCFPKAQTIDVFGPVRMDVPPYHHLRHTDIVNIQTHILTSTSLSAYVEGEWERGIKRCIRTKDQSDIIGTKWKTRENLEGTWLTTTKGARLPKGAKYDGYFLGGTRITFRWEPITEDTLKEYIKRNTQGFDSPLDPVQSDLLRVNPSDNVSQTYRTLRSVPASQFPYSYPMV